MEAKSLGRLLKNQGIVNDNDWSTLEKACGSKPTEIIKGITSIGLISEAELSIILAEKSKATLAQGPLIAEFDRDVLDFVDPVLMQKLEVVPLKEIDEDRLAVALANPLDKSLLRQLEFFTGRKIVPIVATPTQISDCLEELIEGYEAKPSPFDSFIKQFTPPPSNATSRPGATVAPEDLDDFYHDVEITEEEKEITLETSDLDMSSLSSLEGDEEEISFSDPHEHRLAEDEETLDFGEDDSSELDLTESEDTDESTLDSAAEMTGDDLVSLIRDESDGESPTDSDELSADLSLEGLEDESEPIDEGSLVESELLDNLSADSSDDLADLVSEISSEKAPEQEDMDGDISSELLSDSEPAEGEAEMDIGDLEIAGTAVVDGPTMDQGDIDSLFASPVESDLDLDGTESSSQSSELETSEESSEDELLDPTSEPIDQGDIDSLFANMDSDSGELGLEDDLGASSEEEVPQPTADEPEDISLDLLTDEPSSAADDAPLEPSAPVEVKLTRSDKGGKERQYNIANIGVLNRALMDLQFSSEANEAATICRDALSLVFENGIIYLPDREAQILVNWSQSGGNLSLDVFEYLHGLASDLKVGWNSEVTVETSKLPWDSGNELFIYAAQSEKLGKVVWISETVNSEKVTTGIATTCRQILLQFISLWEEFQK